MKNAHIKLLLIGILAIGISACTDLDESPVGLLAPESFFESPADAEAAVFGAYSQLANEEVYGRKLVLSLQMLSDMCDVGDPGTASRRIQLNEFSHDSNNGMISVFWPRLYSAISSTNAAIDGIPDVDMNETAKKELIAEARFLRAFSYYHLVRLFGPVPYIEEFVADPNSLNDIESTPVDDIYEKIIADLNYGKDNLPDSYSGDLKSRPTKGSAATMLASVYLTREEWQEAANEAQYVIDNAGTFNYGLVDDFQEIFRAGNGDTREHIFSLDFLGGINSWPENVDYMAPITGIRDGDQQGWSVSVPSMEVYNSFDDRDYRKEVSFQDSALHGGEMVPYTEFNYSRPHIAKYARFPGENANADGSMSDHNYPAFRYAEVLLIAAEALNEANNGPTSQAYEYFNMIRERARNGGSYPPDLQPGLSQQDFRDAVIEERRVELAFEYKRWYDIVRRDLLEEVFSGPDALETRNVDPSKHYLLPIPQDELNRNPNLRPDGNNNGY